MKKTLITTLALCLYQISARAEAPLAPMNIPPECKNLALMQTNLLLTQFSSNVMGPPAYNPKNLVLNAKGLKITKVEFLGGDGEDYDGPNAGKYPCDLDKTLCNHMAGAGGAFDWARVTVATKATSSMPDNDVAEVVVSMGSRGGCLVNSAKYITKQ